MKEIVKVHFDQLEESLLDQALISFYRLRDLKNIEKKPGTSELIDWLQALTLSGIEPELLKEKLPFAGILLKKDNDLKAAMQEG